MATVDLTAGGGEIPYVGSPNGAYVKKNAVDFSVASRNASDVLQLIDVPADTLVLAVQWKVTTAEGGTFTFDLGDGVDPNGYVDNANGNALAAGASLATTAFSVAVGGGKYYSAADTIDMVLDHAVDAAKIEVRALMVDFNLT